MKTYIGVLALVLATLLSYGIAWHLDSEEPPQRPSRRLLDSRTVAPGESALTPLNPCAIDLDGGVAPAPNPGAGSATDPAPVGQRPEADADECGIQP
ncbi:MAG: hypothetical protein EOP37_11175 [Rubrivivax sp.]|nr:MAG: hypothetical protein EOP37_11175 [Rubrivivax sp.]